MAVTTPASMPAMNPPATPNFVAPTSAPNAPETITPSRLMLMIPARSPTISPSAANASGVAVRTVASRNEDAALICPSYSSEQFELSETQRARGSPRLLRPTRQPMAHPRRAASRFHLPRAHRRQFQSRQRRGGDERGET